MSTSDLWIFGYGSLIWNPEFPFVERQLARLDGYARRFCMSSIHHRGTPEDPGLVLALDAADGTFCTGVAFRLGEEDRDLHLENLRERELVSSAYLERVCPIVLAGGAKVDAITYVIDPDHEQYVKDQSLEGQAAQIARSVGGRGPNPDYLFQTVESLRGLGIEDPDLNWLDGEVRRLIS